MFRPAIFAAPLVLALGLSACGGEDYEAQVGQLQGELQTARTQSEQMRTELAEARARVTELEQASAQPGGQAMGDPDQIRAPLETALAALARSDQRLAQVDGAQQTLDPTAVVEVRENLREAAEAVGSAARTIGVELQTRPTVQ